MEKKLLERFMKKRLEKKNQTEITIVKVIKKKGEKLYVKWKGNGNSFHSWIDTKSIVR